MLLSCLEISAQSKLLYNLTLKITTEQGAPIQDAIITIPSENKYTFSNDNGDAYLSNIINKKLEIEVNANGYKPILKTISLENIDNFLKLNLEEDIQLLDEIILKSKEAQLKEDPIKAEIVNIKGMSAQASNVVEMMNRTVGVRIRQFGGLGSESNIQINGFQGRAIKTFKDGIPIDYLGQGYYINNVPSNQLERIEVYKGSMPSTLGADAMGGAINMVSRNLNKSSGNISYEIGSFNTHRISFNGVYKPENKKWFIGLDAFYNYSDNNYKAEVNVVNEETANIKREKVKLFHNAYKQYYTEIFGGFTDLTWADEIRIGLTSYGIDKDVQYPALMEKPFGAVKFKSNASIIPTLRYEKKLLDDKLHISQFLVYSEYKDKNIDTLRGRYDWHGNFIPYSKSENKRGERGRATLSEVTNKIFTSRTGLNFVISSKHSISLNTVYTHFYNRGTDPFSESTAGTNGVKLIEIPNRYDKVVINTGINSNFTTNIENTFQIKFYSISSKGSEIDSWSHKLIDNSISATVNELGFSEAIKYKISNYSYIRASIERAVRLPDPNELFGNGSLSELPNTNLSPETSMNYNIGVHIENKKNAYVEINSFYRNTKDMISRVVVDNTGDFTQSQNIDYVRGIGLEIEASYPLFKWLYLNANGTYQSFRRNKLGKNEVNQSNLKNRRVGNIPYAFANISARAHFDNTFMKDDKLDIYWYYSYVHMYYLRSVPKEAEPSGFLGLWGKPGVNMENIIPSYGLHNIGFTYKTNKLPLTFGFEFKNIFDKMYYDNFKIQNPGRSISAKIIYKL